MPSTPPNGFDRATGIGGQPGTPNANGTRLINGSTGEILFLEELPDSPTIERAEQGTIVHTFKCDNATAQNIIVNYGRGTYLEDSYGNRTKVLSTRAQQQRGDIQLVTITAESISFDPPPVEWCCEVVELNPAVQKHPRYAILPRSVIAQIVNSVTSADPYKVNDVNNIITGVTLTDLQKQASAELKFKLRKGISEFYLAGLRLTFSSYSNVIRDMDMGGRTEDPTLAEDQFGSYILQDPRDLLYGQDKFIGGSRGGDNAYTNLATQLSPMLYANGITWLRLADSQVYNRTWFKLTHSWIGAPAGGQVQIADETVQWKGHWDEDIYEAQWLGYNTDPFQ